MFGQPLLVCVALSDAGHNDVFIRPAEGTPRDWVFEEGSRAIFDENNCVACTANRAVLYPPCKHVCLCIPCGQRVVNNAGWVTANCPLCRDDFVFLKSLRIQFVENWRQGERYF
jgi:hypothetical protein